MAKIDIVHIPYKGSGPMLTDLVGGQTDFAFDNIASALAFVVAVLLAAGLWPA